jgi:outer membrane protein TolC
LNETGVHMKNILFVVLIILPTQLLAQSKVILSESFLKEMIASDPSDMKQIEASFLSVQREELAKRDQFALKLEGQGNIYKSKERLLSNFDAGVTQSSTTYNVGLVKPTRYGVDLGLKAFTGKSRNIFINDASTSGVTFSLSIDLYQNFLGRHSNNDLRKSETGTKRALLEKKSSVKTFETNLRKLYWSLVANNEQNILLNSLLNSSEKQFKEAQSRNRSGVADSGEVARYRSQWTTRKADLLTLSYRRSEILKSLRQLLPELEDKEIELNNYDINQTTAKVLSCTDKINSYKKAPFELTPYDEIVDYLASEEVYEQKSNNTYNDPQVKFVGEFSNIGRDFGIQNSQNNFYSDPRARTSLGIQVSIPLDGSKSDTMETTKKMAKLRYEAQARTNLAKVSAFHKETNQIIQTLRQVIANQKDTNQSLEKSLQVSRRKFKQARISLQELISEEESHLQSRLNEIDTNLTIINTLMDYFSIYSDLPCDFNRI